MNCDVKEVIGKTVSTSLAGIKCKDRMYIKLEMFLRSQRFPRPQVGLKRGVDGLHLVDAEIHETTVLQH